MIKQTETRASYKTRSSYPNNPTSLFQRVGKDSSCVFKKLATNHHGHTSSAGVQTALLVLIAEPLDRPKLFTVGGYQPFRRSGAHLDYATNHSPIIHSDQETLTIDWWVHGDRKYPLAVWRVILKCEEEKSGVVLMTASGWTHQYPSESTSRRLPGRGDSTYLTPPGGGQI